MIYVLGIVVVSLIIVYLIVKKNHYFQCQYCYHIWKPNFFQIIGNVNCQVNGYHVRCPYCHQEQNIKLSSENKS